MPCWACCPASPNGTGLPWCTSRTTTTRPTSADRTIRLSDSPDNTGMVEIPEPPAAGRRGESATEAPVIELVGVGHEYSSGTPWAKTALRDINFAVEQGDGVLIHGGNGSGKSTLAWIMAGLTIPTSGACLIDGRAHPRACRRGGVVVSDGPAAIDAQPRRPGSGFRSGLFAPRRTTASPRHWRRRTGPHAGQAAHRPAQRWPNAPRGAGRTVGVFAAGVDSRRAAGGVGRRQPAGPAAAAGRICVVSGV